MAEPRLSLDPMTITEAPATTRVTPADERIFVASQWQLMWWRFRKHKLAMVSGIIVIGFYLAALGADFLAYADPNTSEAQRSLMPPQPLYLFDGWRFSPHVYADQRPPRPDDLQARVPGRSESEDSRSILCPRL